MDVDGVRQGSCAACGFRFAGRRALALGFIAEAPRQFAEVLAIDAGVGAAAPASTGWSPLDLTAHVADTLWQAVAEVSRVAHTPEEVVVRVSFPPRPERDLEREQVLHSLRFSAATLLAAASRLPAALWLSSVRMDDAEMSLLELVQRCAHECRHHLADVERIVAEEARAAAAPARMTAGAGAVTRRG